MSDGTLVRPVALAPILESIPPELAGVHRWLLWRYEQKPNRAKWMKPPFRPDGSYASSTNPETWSAFDAVAAAYRADGGWDGVGFVLGEGHFGIDLDDSVNSDGTIKAWAGEIVEAVPTYWERSPSGTGLHCLGITNMRTIAGRRKDGIECYADKQYFTCTGRRINDLPVQTVPSDNLIAFIRKYLPNLPKVAPHAPIVSKVAAADPTLWSGDISRFATKDSPDGDASRADLAMATLIAYYTQDAATIDEVFRQWTGCRPKWIERHDYRARTIAKALTGRHKFADSGGNVAPTDAADVPTDEASGKLVLCTSRTLPTAHAFMRRFYPDNSLVAFGGQIYGWTGSRYEVIEPDMLRNKIQWWLHDALSWSGTGKAKQLGPFPCNPGTINAALESIRSFRSIVPMTIEPPLWLGEHPNDHVDPKQILFGKTKMIDMPSGLEIANSPRMFNLTSLDVDYDPSAERPQLWLNFLRELWGDDQESIDLLQMWFGYCLTADTSQQKALLIIGPKRSGKGTIARILRRLVSKRNCAGPTTTSLANNFGLAPLIGKTLAVVSDARFHGENIRTVTERLLCIIGEDPITVDRKHLDPLECRLQTRFMFLTNEQPRFTDSSGALPSRFLVLELRDSFYGRENLRLEKELIAELPGILAWAVQGWIALQECGKLRNPKSSESLIEELADLASPISAFVRERCIVDPSQFDTTDNLYRAWCEWAKAEGFYRNHSKFAFVKDLRATLPHIYRDRPAPRFEWGYRGVALIPTHPDV